jgi:serine/threonine protein phosphatase Stp1
VKDPIRHCAASHAGVVRTINQDAWLCRPEIGLFAVADGVGGHGHGEVASQRVVAALESIPASLPPEARIAAVRESLQGAHRALLEDGATPSGAFASTVVVLMLHGEHFACLWAGDSRAYLLRDGELCRLTSDHSVVQDLIAAGAITEAEADIDPRRHVITRAIGAGEPELPIEKAVGQMVRGDRFLLCSDGLYKILEPAELAEMLAGPGDVARALLEAALARQARDNVTVVFAAP